jgi:PAS domain S-box-containing protein
MSTKNCRRNGKTRVLLNLLSDPAVIIDEKGYFLTVNDAFEEMTGISRRELIGKPFWNTSILTAESATTALENLKKQIQGAYVEPYEVCFMGKAGETRCTEVKGKKVSYAGLPANLVVFHDVTRRKENTRRLKEYSERMEVLVEEQVKEIQDSEAKFRAISTCAIDAIFLFDEEDRITYWNPAAERIFGYTEKEIVGKQVNATLVPPHFREDHLKLTEKLSKVENNNSAGVIQEYSALRKDGTEFSIELSMTPLQLDGKSCSVAIARDVTERNRLQDRDSTFGELSYRLVSRASSDEISYQVLDYAQRFTHSPVGYVGYIDQKTGYLIVPAYTTTVLAQCKIENKTTVFKDFRGLYGWSLSNRKSFFTNTPNADPRSIGTPTGHLLINRFLSVPALFEGKLVGQIAVANSDREYTEEDVRLVESLAALYAMALQRKHVENQLQEYANSLEEKVAERTKQLEVTNNRLVRAERFAAIGELAGMVGHDLRNPLTAIKNAAYYLRVKQGSCLEDNRKKMLSVIESAIAHADKIIYDLQEYSREMKLELANCSPQSILKEALTIIQIPDRVKIIDETLEEPIIRADKAKMVRIFINLIKNAVDAMPEEGTLQVKSTRVNDNVEISFTDTGIGMPEETLAKLFSPLITTKARGMGFGLAICKRILEAHQGKITVQSVEGKGTTVTVAMPAEPEPKGERIETWVNVPEYLLSTTKT